MTAPTNTPSSGLVGGRRRRDWYALEERHAVMLRGRVVALVAIAAAVTVLPREATTREHLLAVAACAVALALHVALVLAPVRWPRRLLGAVDAALVVDAGLILTLAALGGGVDALALWLLPVLALAVTLGHSTGFGVKALILGGIVIGALYALEDPGAPGLDETAGPLIVAAAVVVIAAVFNAINERDLQRRLERLDGKWIASTALIGATSADEVLSVVRPAFGALLPGWDVAVGLGGGDVTERSWRDAGRVLVEVPLPGRVDGAERVLGRMTASRPLPGVGRPTIRRREMEAVREVASDAGSALARIAAVERLERLSLADPLTGLGNRRAFDDALVAEMARSARSGDPVGLVMIDVDHFKRFNDRHGHQAGDEALVAVAEVLGTVARASDRACRIGGEEFALVIPGADETAAAAVAERIRAGIESSPPPAGPLTVSLGVAATRDGGGGDGLVRDADLRLYAAKEAGRNRVVAGSA